MLKQLLTTTTLGFINTSILSAVLLSSPAAKADIVEGYSPTFEVSTRHSKKRHIAELDYMQPVWGNEEFLSLVDLKLKTDNDKSKEVNLGLAARYNFGDNVIMGVYGYFDHRRTGNDFGVSGATIGAEALSKYLDVRVNYYVPQDKKKKTADGGKKKVEIQGTRIYAVSGGHQYEYALKGYDFEVGTSLFAFNDELNDKFGTKLFVAKYDFRHKKAKPISGIRFRLEQKLGHLSFGGNGLDFTLNAETQYDKVRKRQNYIGVGAKLTFGNEARKKPSQLKSRMMDTIIRDVDIVTETAKSARQISEFWTKEGRRIKNVYYVGGAGGGYKGTGTKDDPLSVGQLEAVDLSEAIVVVTTIDATKGGQDLTRDDYRTLQARPEVVSGSGKGVRLVAKGSEVVDTVEVAITHNSQSGMSVAVVDGKDDTTVVLNPTLAGSAVAAVVEQAIASGGAAETVERVEAIVAVPVVEQVAAAVEQEREVLVQIEQARVEVEAEATAERARTEAAQRRAQEEQEAAARAEAQRREQEEAAQRRAQEEQEAAQRRAQEEQEAAQRRAQEEQEAAQRRAQEETQRRERVNASLGQANQLINTVFQGGNEGNLAQAERLLAEVARLDPNNADLNGIRARMVEARGVLRRAAEARTQAPAARAQEPAARTQAPAARAQEPAVRAGEQARGEEEQAAAQGQRAGGLPQLISQFEALVNNRAEAGIHERVAAARDLLARIRAIDPTSDGALRPRYLYLSNTADNPRQIALFNQAMIDGELEEAADAIDEIDAYGITPEIDRQRLRAQYEAAVAARPAAVVTDYDLYDDLDFGVEPAPVVAPPVAADDGSPYGVVDSGVDRGTLSATDQLLYDLILRIDGFKLDLVRDANNDYVLADTDYNAVKLLVDASAATNPDYNSAQHTSAVKAAIDRSTTSVAERARKKVYVENIVRAVKGEMDDIVLEGEQAGVGFNHRSSSDISGVESLFKLREIYGVLDGDVAVRILKRLAIHAAREKLTTVRTNRTNPDGSFILMTRDEISRLSDEAIEDLAVNAAKSAPNQAYKNAANFISRNVSESVRQYRDRITEEQRLRPVPGTNIEQLVAAERTRLNAVEVARRSAAEAIINPVVEGSDTAVNKFLAAIRAVRRIVNDGEVFREEVVSRWTVRSALPNTLLAIVDVKEIKGKLPTIGRVANPENIFQRQKENIYRLLGEYLGDSQRTYKKKATGYDNGDVYPNGSEPKVDISSCNHGFFHRTINAANMIHSKVDIKAFTFDAFSSDVKSSLEGRVNRMNATGKTAYRTFVSSVGDNWLTPRVTLGEKRNGVLQMFDQNDRLVIKAFDRTGREIAVPTFYKQLLAPIVKDMGGKERFNFLNPDYKIRTFTAEKARELFVANFRVVR